MQPADAVVPPSPDVRITPDGASYRRGLGYRAAIFLPLVVGMGWGASRTTLPPAIVWVIIAVGVLIGVVAVLWMVTAVDVSEGGVEIRRLVGARRRVSLASVSASVFVDGYEQFGNALSPLLVVTDAAGRRILRLSGQLYAAADLQRLAHAIGHAEMIAGPVTPKQLHARFPHTVPFWERHPFVIAWIVVVVIVAAATAVALAIAG